MPPKACQADCHLHTLIVTTPVPHQPVSPFLDLHLLNRSTVKKAKKDAREVLASVFKVSGPQHNRALFLRDPSHRPVQRDFRADELMTAVAAVQAFRTHRPIKWSRRDLHITAAGSFGSFGSHCFWSGNTSLACCSKQQQACVCRIVPVFGARG